MQLSAKEIANIVEGNVEGDPEVLIDRPSRIEEGGKGSVSFLGNAKYEAYVYTTTASALLVSRDFQPKKPVDPTLIRVENVYTSIAQLLDHFGINNGKPTGVAPSAVIHPEADLKDDVAVGANTTIEAGVKIGSGTTLFAQVYIGQNVKIGQNTLIYPGVRILHNCMIGDNCIIHPNAVLGSDGFGFAPDPKGKYQKVPQTGNVIIENDVEVGACTTIDRATIGSTIVRAGVKLDNLIQVGHNVEIGENTVIAAQTGIAGSTKIGKNCQVGGQVGFVGHLSIADNIRIQAQSGIASSVKEPNQALFGYPAIEYGNYIRSYAVFKQLPDLYKRIHELEKRLKEKEEQS